MAQIRCNDLRLGYDGNVVASGIGFEVNEGDYLAVVGENGSGKSTLLKTLLGLIKPISGEITLGDGLTKTGIGYLPQQTPVQRDFPASVGEVVLSGRQGGRGLRPFYSAEDKRVADFNMERMGVLAFKNRSYKELSGGQQQRVLLARALCATEKLLVLDEPVSGLDPVVTAEMYGLIEQINASGITIIMISHDIPSALRYATRILHIGKHTFFGSVEEYRQSEIAKRFAINGGSKNDAD